MNTQNIKGIFAVILYTSLLSSHTLSASNTNHNRKISTGRNLAGIALLVILGVGLGCGLYKRHKAKTAAKKLQDEKSVRLLWRESFRNLSNLFDQQPQDSLCFFKDGKLMHTDSSRRGILERRMQRKLILNSTSSDPWKLNRQLHLQLNEVLDCLIDFDAERRRIGELSPVLGQQLPANLAKIIANPGLRKFIYGDCSQ